MKRILFYSENFCGAKVKGGLEVATFRIAEALKNSGQWKVYNSFRSKSDRKETSIYSDVIKLSKIDSKFQSQLKAFIIRNEIDVVVNMSRFFCHKMICKAAGEADRDVKVLFMQHFAPGSEMKKPTFKSGLHLLKLNPLNPIYWFRASLYPLIKLPRQLKYPRIYKETYRDSDKVVVLSEGYCKNYCKIANIQEDSKFVAIPNIFQPISNLEFLTSAKEKRVLILSRMDEIQKRISLALKIWKKIEENIDLDGWHLDIVGSGHNSDIVKKLLKEFKIERATYHGWQPREPFLQKASILMSTSEYEGLPLAILEAQAYGTVPIAFDSYTSLRDVVSPYENGVIVDSFGDIDDFTKKLTDLMSDDAFRSELSKNAIESADRFSSNKIGAQWFKMLENL